MNEKLLNDLVNLKNTIKNSPEYLDLQNKNEILNKDDNVKILSYKKDIAIMNYEDSLKHYDKNSLEVISTEKEMSKAIYTLNNYVSVKDYNISYSKLAQIYKEINDVLFGFYRGKNL